MAVLLEKPFVYIVEDDAAIAGELARALEREGFRTAAAERFDRVVPDILAAAPDLVLLDLTLPGTDGQFIARDLREHSQVPIIVLTSRTTEIDEVMAMNLGADDFIPKPYRLRVLVARIQALLRRADGGAATILSHNGVELDSARSVARANGREVELTKNECRILALLMSRAGQVVPRADIMRDLWESEAFIDDNTLTVNINRLRATLEKIGVANYLVTKRGQGYTV
ncbi:Response regulator protein GraR [Collinsella sp. AK_207A]|uniref:response regulator transcription factor n=1 Tax=Collinsella sp. AK_207A TaxID=2650472 RepID=UPI001283EA25|nr:response regulator transcription factor [Collinsella sp. AK_207A]VWM03432.1 Response regulator protein GraR [Collinsella sp. AK_207A]